MFSFRVLLLRHGYLFVFVYVLAVQAGLPIPADPLLLLMGAMVGDQRYSFVKSLFAAFVPALLGDLLWYELGRLRGSSILRFLCKLSIEPDTCVRKTQMAFTKKGAQTLLFAKFIPGMSLVSMPLAGMIHMPRWRFLLADAAGCILWSCTYLSVGFLFHRQVDDVIEWLGLLGRRAGLVVLLLLLVYLAFKYLQRWRILRQLRINRVTPFEVQELLKEGDAITIVDLRHSAEVERDPMKLPGALILRPEDLRSRAKEIPPEHEVILYCT